MPKLLNIYLFHIKGGGKMTYKEFIEDILTTRGRHGCGEAYHEKHHIKPRCLGGEDVEENYIDLYAREHFTAHKLLALENPHNSKLQYAWWLMSNVKDKNQDRYECTPEDYEKARIAFSKVSSERMSGENHPFYGKHLSEETKCKISEALKGENAPNYGKHLSEETRKKISKSHTGMTASEETKKKMSESTKGDKNPMYHKHHTEETRKIMSEKKKGKCVGENNPHWGKHHTEETKQKMSQMKKGSNNPNARKVYCKELDMTFDTIKEAQDYVGITSGILQCCSTKYNRETAGKHPLTNEKLHWEFAK